MSKLVTPGGDDHPEAARKNLKYAGALLAGNHADGAAYLSGYVVESSLKSIYQLETGKAISGHDWSTLHAQVSAVCAVAGAKAARYLGTATTSILSSAVAAWAPGMRYRAPSMTMPEATAWHQSASAIFGETIANMWKDGVL